MTKIAIYKKFGKQLYTDQEEWNGVPDTLHTQTNTHTCARASWQITGM